MARLILWDLIRLMLWPIVFFVYRLRAYGQRNIPDSGPVLLLCNHQSYLDLVALGVTIPHRHFYAMARRTLFRGWFGGLLRALNAFEVDQERGDLRAIRRAIELLKTGYLVLIFPEGSRTPDGITREFQEGVMLLLRRARPVVVPAAVEGVYDAWPIWSKRPRLRARIAAAYGNPVTAEQLLELAPHEALDRLRGDVEALRADLQRKLQRQTGGRYPQHPRT